jgi:hypothetical protein
MFSGDAADAVKNDPARYTLDIPADADLDNPRPREPDALANLFQGKSTGAPRYEQPRRNRPSRRRPNRRRG